MIYDYQCTKCEFEFELEHKLNEKPKGKCPECGSKSMKRIITTARFSLKGCGWAKDGYRDTQRNRINEANKVGE